MDLRTLLCIARLYFTFVERGRICRRVIEKSDNLYMESAVCLKCHFLSSYDLSGPTVYYSLYLSPYGLRCCSNSKMRNVSKVG